jgi:hypothetical protein
MRSPLPASIREPAPPPIVPAAEPAEANAPDAALANMAQRLEAALRRPGVPEPRQTVRPEPELAEPPPTAPDLAAPQADTRPAKPKSVLDSLEEEMASLLGRPPEKQ